MTQLLVRLIVSQMIHRMLQILIQAHGKMILLWLRESQQLYLKLMQLDKNQMKQMLRQILILRGKRLHRNLISQILILTCTNFLVYLDHPQLRQKPILLLQLDHGLQELLQVQRLVVLQELDQEQLEQELQLLPVICIVEMQNLKWKYILTIKIL